MDAPQRGADESPEFPVKYSILTFGCKVNQYDGQAMREALGAFFEEAAPGERADIVVVNTCTVTSEADRQGRQAMRRARRDHPGAAIVAAGCYARRMEGESGTGGLADLVARGPGAGPVIDALGLAARGRRGIASFRGHSRAFVKVQDGCDRRCSFCVVPSVRGRSVSRPAREIAAEVGGLAGAGYREVVLCGVCLDAYRDPGGRGGLARLVEKLVRVEGLARLRLSSLYPGRVDPALIALVTGHPKVCRHAHLPVQSGSDRVLRAMRRGYTADGVRTLAAALRAGEPRMGLTADVIAGFPGETDADARETERLLEECGFQRLHLFPFSPRPGTPAASLPRPPADAVRERMGRLRALEARLLAAAGEREVGAEAEVVVESRLRDGWRRGLADNYHTVTFRGGASRPGTLVRLRITGAAGGELRGVAARGGNRWTTASSAR